VLPQPQLEVVVALLPPPPFAQAECAPRASTARLSPIKLCRPTIGIPVLHTGDTLPPKPLRRG